MSKQTEALKMAYKAEETGNLQDLVDAVNMLVEVVEGISKTETTTQEPVAWVEEEFNAIAYAYRSCPAHEVKMISERYQDLVDYVLSIAHPAPSWQGLSNDEIRAIDDVTLGDYYVEEQAIKFARAIEQVLKERNT